MNIDSKKSPFGGLLGSYGGGDPNIDVPVTSSGNTISPYLNFDPAVIAPSPESQFIFPEGASHQRGRFEFAFSQIGGSVFLGAAVGGVRGTYSGLLETKELTGAVKRTQMLNYITKQGASSAQSLGVIALMYSILGVVISKTRGAEDELNTLASAGITGMLYKSSAGRAGVLRGGVAGIGLAAVYCLFTSRERFKQVFEMH